MVEQAFIALRLTHRFDVAPERVFDAWLDPTIAGLWLFTGPTSETHKTEIDPRVGGHWRITDLRDGVDYMAHGEYLEIDRPRRLVFTFGMPQFSPEFARVTVEIAPDGAGCVLTLLQEPVPQAARDGLDAGWREMFGQLAKALAG